MPDHDAAPTTGRGGTLLRDEDSTPSVRRKADRPETPRQARTWERIKADYLDAGLCHRCAALAAYGHQLGFANLMEDPTVVERGVEPTPLTPCEECVPLVAGFPNPKTHGWRGLARKVPTMANHSQQGYSGTPGDTGRPQIGDGGRTRAVAERGDPR